MKHFISLLFFSVVVYNLFAAEPDPQKLTIKENSYNKLEFSFALSVDDIQFLKVKTPRGMFAQTAIAGYGYSLEYGKPRLPVLKKLIEVTLGATMEIQITKLVTSEYRLSDLGVKFPLIPAQPSVSKSDDPAMLPFIYHEHTYQTPGYYGRDVVDVINVGQMRCARIARLEVAPMQYDPVSGMIRIVTELEAVVVFKNPDISKTLTEKQNKYSPYFEAAYSTLLNYKHPVHKDALSKYPVKYVIIADTMFQAALQPFIDWKTKKGFTVIEGYTSDPAVGNTTNSIKNYIQGLYNAGTVNDPAPTFVLFVGDVAQVPSFPCSGHVSDLYYCEYTGDYIPEIYYGRFSATTVNQLQPQIDKTLQYEQYNMPSKSFLNEVVMIAGVDGSMAPTYGNGQINYGTDNYFNLTNGITSHTYLYPASQTSAAAIIADVSNGVGYANYTAHGGSNGWSDPAFSTLDIPSLNNTDKYPLMVGNACLTNKFDDTECFGEALLRASGRGALGYIGASNSSYWYEDYYWGVGFRSTIVVNPVYDPAARGAYDGVFHTHGEPFSSWFMTQAQMMFAGNLAVTQSGSSVQYYWEIYHLMGDPSLMVYFGEPPAITAIYNPLIPLSATSLQVQTDPYGYAAVSMNGVLLGAALADSLGNVTVPLSGITASGTADIVITRQNRAPHISTIVVDNPAGAYVMYLNNDVNDSLGNSNHLVDYNETIFLDVTLHNYGLGTANAVSTAITSTSADIVLTDNAENWGNIGAGLDAARNNAFAFSVANNIPDQQVIPFTINIQDNAGGNWASNFNLVANAPQLAIGNFMVDDAGGNNNGCLDTSETVSIIIETFNDGHADALSTTGTLSTTCPYVTLNNTTHDFDTMASGSFADAVFSLTVAAAVPDTVLVDLIYTVVSGAYSASITYYLPLGLVSEDWESGDFSLFNWQQTGDIPWIITNVNPQEGIYCAQSGDISDNQNSVLAVSLNVMTADSVSFFKKVSCEPGQNYGGTYYWYDYLEFLIDGVSLAQWDGEVNWSRSAFAVTVGQHSFTWKYHKDASMSEGSDCAWLDYILFPPVMTSVQGMGESAATAGMSVYPNPSSGQVTVTFTLQEQQAVSLRLYDVLGKEITTLIDGQEKLAGTYRLLLNAGAFGKGVYFVHFIYGNQLKTEKIIITK